MKTVEELAHDLEQDRLNMQNHIEEDRAFHKQVLDRLDSMSTQLNPIVDVYKALLFNKSFIMGLGSIIGAITVIGSAVYWLLHQNN